MSVAPGTTALTAASLNTATARNAGIVEAVTSRFGMRGNTAGQKYLGSTQMPEDVRNRYQRLRWLVVKLETNHAQVDEMMLNMVQDGLGAMRYGQYGGSFPDPTARTVFDAKTIVDADGIEHETIIWRSRRAEEDRIDQAADLEFVEKALERMDTRRQFYMSANNEIRNRLDPTEFCHIHFHLRIYDGHRRAKGTGNLCPTCFKFYGENGREPTPTEAEHFHRKGTWPHKLVDPKERRAV